jgi:hypothetical protein
MRQGELKTVNLKEFRQPHTAGDMHMMNPVVHFEMPYRNRDRAATFYAAAFGWQTHKLGPEMGDYLLVTTALADARPGAPAGAINGGLFPAQAGVARATSLRGHWCGRCSSCHGAGH